MEKAKYTITNYWQIIVAIVLVIFNVGYTVKALEDKPSKEEVKKEIKTAIDEHKIETKDNYININQVPGLTEQLDAINKQLEVVNKKLDKFEDKIIYGR